MASPQCENGYTKIANELIEALMHINLSSYESRVLWCIIRKTYGFNKKMDRISLSQFSEYLDVDRRLVHRALKRLEAKNLVIIDKESTGVFRYGVQKDHSNWVSSKKMTGNKATVIYRDDKVPSDEMTKLSSKEIPTKEKKETIQKKSTENRSTCPQKDILNLYHEMLPELPSMKIWSEERAAHLRARWNSGITLKDGIAINALEYWRRFFKYVRQSDFLMGNTQGRNGGKPFQANLEWLVKKSNFIKVIEGQYHG